MGNKKKVLIVVDVQNDFVTGSLGTPEAQAIVPKIKEKFEEHKNNGDYVVYTMDTHNSDYLNTSEGKKLPVEHCIYRTSGWEVIDEIHPVKNNYNNFMVCKKSTFGYEGWDWETGEIKGLDLSGEIDQLPGKDILIVDDICSRGGTFYYSAKKLKEAGVGKIYLYITHCENTIYEGELLKNNGLIEKIYTTDTILTNLESPKIELVERFR